MVVNAIGGLGECVPPSKLLKGPSGKAGGPFNVACKIGDGFSIVESGSKVCGRILDPVGLKPERTDVHFQGVI